MANLISVKSFCNFDGSRPFSPSIDLPVNVGDIQTAIANTTSGISGVNTSLYVKYHDGNSTRLGTLLVNDAASAIVTASNVALGS